MPPRFSELSTPEWMRVFIWRDAIDKAHRYLLISQTIKHEFPKADDYMQLDVGDVPMSFHIHLTTRMGLIEAAIIMLRQIFSTGNSCRGIAKNRGNPIIDSIRSSMEDFSVLKLDWTRDEYIDFTILIKNQRDQQIAHFDGSKAGFDDSTEGLIRTKSVGATINLVEEKRLLLIVSSMHEYITKYIHETID